MSGVVPPDEYLMTGIYRAGGSRAAEPTPTLSRVEHVARRLNAGAAHAAPWEALGGGGQSYWLGLAQEAVDALDEWDEMHGLLVRLDEARRVPWWRRWLRGGQAVAA